MEDNWAEDVYKELRDLMLVRVAQRVVEPPPKQLFCLVCQDYFTETVRDHIRLHMSTSTPPPEFS